MSWHNIGLTSQLRNPETMDHIVREEINMYNRFGWYLKRISSSKVVLWIVEFPPPLVTQLLSPSLYCHQQAQLLALLPATHES